jgi:hypothetical protein
MLKAFNWNLSRISMLEVQIDLSIVLYMKSLLLVESFDFHLSNQHILVRVSPSCFHFAKMCLCQVRLLLRYLTSTSFVSCTCFSLCSECYMDWPKFVGFHSPFLKPVLNCK